MSTEGARHLVVGTAGHIDHGKSALVQALTGVDPDRLKEEKRRGITIELGFADLDLGEGRALSFVDVPGHERFVRQMVAGVTGIDAVLLAIAADQSIQPQSREHLDICSLLGVRRGVVALTKCDLIDDDLLEVVVLEVREWLQGTFLEGAPIVSVSARQGRGMDALRGELERLLDDGPRRSTEGLTRLPVDRSFVLKGLGAVVTGTLVSGELRDGEELVVLPGNRRARVRGLQVHHRKTAVACAGQRTAVNLQGVDAAQVPRGSTLTEPGGLIETRRVWVRLRLLASAPRSLEKGGPVQMHQGTDEQAGRLRILSRWDDELLAEIRLARPMVLAPADRFILRRPAPVDTIGGGVVLDVSPPRRSREAASLIDRDVLERPVALELRLERAGLEGREPATLGAELGLTRRELDDTFATLQASGRGRSAGSRWFFGPGWTGAEGCAVETVARFHADQPLQRVMSREALRAAVAPTMPQEAWRELLESVAGRGELRLEGEGLAATGHRVQMEGAALALARRLESAYRDAGLEPPDLEALLEPGDRERAQPVVDLLIAEGKLVRIQDRRLFHSEALETLRSRLQEYARTSPTIDVAAFKELAGVTRKNAIPLLEQLDFERRTRRVGNLREIVG